ncbi:MAG: hypothetical protein FJW96_17705 [Actinobacteria bacterium]|nr:hypothetical protein [Actinomycetota bacterium]
MDVTEYEEDFRDPRSRAEFAALRARAAWSASVAMPEGTTTADLARERLAMPPDQCGTARNTQYARLGLFIAMQSSLVVAMWDGIDTGKPGGTSAVVGFCREGRVDAGTIPFRGSVKALEPSEPLAVAWIPTRREGSPEPSPRAGPVAPALDARLRAAWSQSAPDDAPLPVRWRDLATELRHLESLNEAIARTETRSTTGSPPANGTPFDLLQSRLDAAAGRSKVLAMRAMKLLVAVIALVVLSLQATMAWSWWAWPTIYLLGLLAALGFWTLLRRRGIERRSADLRLLAETMRVQAAWWRAGIREQASDHFLAHRAIAIPDLRLLLRGASLRGFEVAESAGGDDLAALRATKDGWIDTQSSYMNRKCTILDARMRRGGLLLRGLASLVILAALASLALTLADETPLSERLFAWVDFSCGATLTISLAVGLWQRIRGDREDLRRYEAMRKIFALASRRIEDALRRGDAAAAREVIRAAGKEALDEQSAWHALHRETFDELPVG